MESKREAGITNDVVVRQLLAGLAGLPAAQAGLGRVIQLHGASQLRLRGSLVKRREQQKFKHLAQFRSFPRPIGIGERLAERLRHRRMGDLAVQDVQAVGQVDVVLQGVQPLVGQGEAQGEGGVDQGL